MQSNALQQMKLMLTNSAKAPKRTPKSMKQLPNHAATLNAIRGN